MSASPLAKIMLKVKFGGGVNKNFIPYHPLVRIRPGSSAFRYQHANDPAAAVSGWPIAQCGPNRQSVQDLEPRYALETEIPFPNELSRCSL